MLSSAGVSATVECPLSPRLRACTYEKVSSIFDAKPRKTLIGQSTRGER